jgi:hypothetical protein
LNRKKLTSDTYSNIASIKESLCQHQKLLDISAPKTVWRKTGSSFQKPNNRKVNLGLNFSLIGKEKGKGENRIEMRIRNITSVIEESNADIAKFDCEGAEISLTTVPKQTLGKIEFYMIEVHSTEIRKAITDPFTTSGFIQSRAPADDIPVLYFKKVP